MTSISIDMSKSGASVATNGSSAPKPDAALMVRNLNFF
jgi:hypothetical protein